MTRGVPAMLLTFALTGAPGFPVAAGAQVAIQARLAVAADGTPSDAWLKAVAVFDGDTSVSAAIDSAHPLTTEERDWAALVTSRLAAWSGTTEELALPFGPVVPPDPVIVMIGNAAGQDAFTPSDTTIAFDVARLALLYGDAGDPANLDRIDRFFAHEYTHVLHKAWLRDHHVDLSTPLRRTLWHCLVEGMGNYRSLSDRWKGANGGPSAHARDTLARLEPIFTERIAALAHADESEEAKLTEGLSTGPFEEKWGALTVALWLLDEARGDDSRLAAWIAAGPPGVLQLVHRHLPADLASELPTL